MASRPEDTGEETTPPVTTQQRDPASRASPTADVGKLCSGRCKWFDVSKGYGFITTDDNSGDVFVYQSSIQMGGFRSLEENEAVEFVFKISGKGREAESVTGPCGEDCKGSKRKGRAKHRRRDDRCYNCNEHGHHAKNCTEPPLPKRCHHCKSEEHLIADCPDKPAQGEKTPDNGQESSDTPGDGSGAPATSGDQSTSSVTSEGSKS
ncbi:protein lin-28 homolog isoform X2 [Asterias rubens]|uniref:protein lin-28 homolog isoform X2 n=1 Tax=Asterias rubens TaxID=7604 RepID=UPI0014550B3D|nr:protein lin-28 homolog isoform X2 [Asterias rubens]